MRNQLKEFCGGTKHVEVVLGAAAQREGVLLLLCLLSDVLPRLMDNWLKALPVGRVVIDNALHAAIAAASWAVVSTLSAPPRGSGCTLFANNPSSPAQRLFSFFRRRFRRIHGGKEGSNKLLAATPASKSSSSGQEEEGGGDATESVPIRGWDSRMGADAMESFLAACLGSALDVDHFLAAGSLRLSKARGLTQRSWGHSIAVLLLAAAITGAFTFSKRAAAIVFVPGASHQLRDSTRRGLWLYPPRGPKTPPVTYTVYLLAQVVLPLATASFLRRDGILGAVWWCFRGKRRATSAGSSECARGEGL